MVKILKHGKRYYFCCTACGCEWIAGVKEIRRHTTNAFFGKFGYMGCPDCDAMTKGELVQKSAKSEYLSDEYMSSEIRKVVMDRLSGKDIWAVSPAELLPLIPEEGITDTRKLGVRLKDYAKLFLVKDSIRYSVRKAGKQHKTVYTFEYAEVSDGDHKEERIRP